MSQAGLVTGLAIRELWISFRLLGLLVLFVGAGVVVALLPSGVDTTLERLALGLALAVAAVAAVAARSLAVERVTGRAGWLVGRSVGRWTLLAGWFGALAILAVVGLGVAGSLGWLTISAASRPGPIAYAALVGAIAGWSLAAVAVGLLLGTLVGPRIAAAAALLVCLGLGLASWSPVAGSGLMALLPSAGIGLLAHGAEPGAVIGPALRAAGIALAAAAALLALARFTLQRAEL